MRKIFLSAIAICGLALTSCSDCTECQGVRYCKDSGATYTDSTGQAISWEEYKAHIEASCP